MYTTHFGLRELPFTITPDTSFFFAEACHRDALNTLLLAVRSGEGFVKVVGEVGTGKTLLCRTFLGALDPQEFVTGYILNPYLRPESMLRAVADEFGLDCPADLGQHDLLKTLTHKFLESYAERRRAVLCLDEAQAIPLETLEVLRLLSNLETERRKLLQVVLFGQPELDERLDHPSIRQLRQRIAFSCRLVPFTRTETAGYLAHRMRVSGYAGESPFSPRAVSRLHRASRGVPRLLNILAHKALMAAFGDGREVVTGRQVRAAVRDTESVWTAMRARYRRRWRYAVALLATLAFSAGAWVWGGWI